MKRCFIAALFLMHINAFGQQGDSLMLEYCLKQAELVYPLAKQAGIFPEISSLRLQNLAKSYYPQVNLNGQASYQSDVTEFPFNIPGSQMPEFYNDVYKVSLDINQLVYDGGYTLVQKRIEQKGLEIDQQNLATELYKVKERVEQLFFNILMLQQNKVLIRLAISDLESRIGKIESGVRNGLLPETNLISLKVERLRLEQQLMENESNRLSALKMLALYTGIVLNDSTACKIPEPGMMVTDNQLARPELRLFDLQAVRFDEMKNIYKTRTMPKLYAFAQAGYGRPGMNMYNEDFDDYYMIGLKLNWNVWNWKQNNTDKTILDFQKSLVTNQKEVFEKNTSIQLEKEKADVEKFNGMVEKDLEIIKLKEANLKMFASQLENGIITSSDYINELNSLTQFRLNLESHRLQAIKAHYNYLFLIGKL
jgi:outer membrane protein TolC